MENQENKVFEVFVTDGDKKKSVYLDSYKVTIAVSAVLVILFVFGLIWLASSSAENNLIKNGKNASSGGSLFHSGSLSDNFNNSVADAKTQNKNNSPIFISTPPGITKQPAKTPAPEPTSTPVPNEDNNDDRDEPEPTVTPTPTPAPDCNSRTDSHIYSCTYRNADTDSNAGGNAVSRR